MCVRGVLVRLWCCCVIDLDLRLLYPVLDNTFANTKAVDFYGGCMRRGSLGVRLSGGQQLACPDSAQLYRELWIIHLFYSLLCDRPRFTSFVSCFG